MDILFWIISTIISTGIISAFIHQFYEKRIKTHDYKLDHYTELIEQLSRLTENNADWDKLRTALNSALFYASDSVVREVLDFNERFTTARTSAASRRFQMTANDVQGMIKAIRKDLFLCSRAIDEKGLRFFQKP